MSYQVIVDNFQTAKTTPSNIYQHIETLYHYGRVSNQIIVCGTKYLGSTWALLMGLADNSTTSTKELICCDDSLSPSFKAIGKICQDLKIKYSFKIGSNLIHDFPEADLIFIDTQHTYDKISKELVKFAPICQKYLIMLDTSVDAFYSEVVRQQTNIPYQSEIKLGMKPAIDNFLGQYSQFVIKRHEEYNNGLTVLAKIEPKLPSTVILVGTYHNDSIDRRMIQIWRSLPIEADIILIRQAENLPIKYLYKDHSVWINVTSYSDDFILMMNQAKEFLAERTKWYDQVITTMSNRLIIDSPGQFFDRSEEGLNKMISYVEEKYNIKIDLSDPLLYM